jgi:hypothetical protein
VPKPPLRVAAPPRTGTPLVDEALLRDARFVCDVRHLASLHGELRRRLGEEDAARALLQVGFHHGLRDGLRAANAAQPRTRFGDGPPPAIASLLALDLASGFDAHGPCWSGSWPRHREADAVAIARGKPAEPACLISAGYTSGWLSALFDDDVLAVERCCVASGADRCAFEARDAAAWRARGDARAIAWLDALPWAAQRDAVARERAADDAGEDEAFDPESPAVHVWGPVMVVPYAGEETAVAIEAVARDPGASRVSVVIVDLGGAVVDDGFGAAALERVLDVIAGWGAEALLTGVASHAEGVVQGLASAPFVLAKDLRAAIATAFQIAESQRRPS